MQIVIDIPDSDIPKKQEIIEVPIHFIDGTVCEAGGFGFDVLPKGHGRLKDADELRQKWIFGKSEKKEIDDAPTIIEADNAESEAEG